MKYDLYVVTDDRISNGLSHVDVAKRAYDGGADIVQLRVKNDDPRFLMWAKEISEYSREMGRTFIVNDNVDIALCSGADGVHVGQDDMSVPDIRKMVSEDFIIGVSVGSVKEAIRAESEGATYVALSPIFDTKTKFDAGHGHGIETLKEIVKNVNVPVIAIGGIGADNVDEIIEAGADGVAVVSAVASQKDIVSATKFLKDVISQAKIRASADRQ